MSVKITVVFTILISTVLQNVSSALEQEKDFVQSEIQSASDEVNSDYNVESEENHENEDDCADSFYQNVIREYNYGIDLLYSGQKQSGQLNSDGKNIVTGEYYFVEKGKEYKVSYVADENGYRPKYSVMETTKYSPPTYQGKKETGKYTFQPTEIEEKPLQIPPSPSTGRFPAYQGEKETGEYTFRPTEIEVKPSQIPPSPSTGRFPAYQGEKETGEYTFPPTEIEVKPIQIPPSPLTARFPEPDPYDPLIVASLLGGG